MTTIGEKIAILVTHVEGDYKWYIIGGIILILAALITRFIFKTLKWFLLAVVLGLVVISAALFGPSLLG